MVLQAATTYAADMQVEDGRPLDVSLATFAKKIPSLPVVLDDTALKKAKRNFVKRLRNPKCDVCAGETKCGRDKVEHDLLGERRQCIEALLDLLTQLRRLCDDLYCTRWPAAGFEDTEIIVFIEPEAYHGASEVYG